MVILLNFFIQIYGSSFSLCSIYMVQQSVSSSPYLVAAIIFLLDNYPDISHELVLGVTFDNYTISQAEYAATHPGNNTWSKQRPTLSTSSDLLHSILHRLEGEQLGEGGYSGSMIMHNIGLWVVPRCWTLLQSILFELQ